jgi:hypothetical protein
LPAPAQGDVKIIGSRIHRHGALHIHRRNQRFNRLGVLDRADDGSDREQRIAFEIKLRNQTLGKAMSEDRKMDMRRVPGVHAIRPRIRLRHNCPKLVFSIRSRNDPPATAKVGIKRRDIAFLVVPIPPARIRLPNLNQRAPGAPPEFVMHQGIDNDPRTDRAFAVEIVDQVGVVVHQQAMTECRACDL